MTEPPSLPRPALRSVLRNPLSVIAAALASFLVVLVLLSARVLGGHDPALYASAPGSVLVSRNGHTIVRTTASGRVLGPATGRSAAQAGQARPATLVTRASGGLADGGRVDE